MVGNTSYRPRDQVRQPPLFLLSDTHALKDEWHWAPTVVDKFVTGL